MSINLSCCDLRMTKQFFHTFYSCAVVEHCRSERMSQYVRRALFLGCHLCEIIFYDLSHLCRSDSLAFVVDEQRPRFTTRHALAFCEVFLQVGLEFISERHHPVLVSLAPYLYLSFYHIHRLDVHSRHFRHSDTGLI